MNKKNYPERFTLLLFPFLLFLVPFALAAVFAVAAGEIASKAELLGEESVDGTATILDLRQLIRRNSGTPRRVHYATYQFTPPGAAPITRESEVSMGFYSKIKAIQLRGETTIPIRYLPTSPDIHEIEPGRLNRKFSGSSILALTFAGLSLLPLSITIRRAYLIAKNHHTPPQKPEFTQNPR